MSGVAGGSRIEKPDVHATFDKYIKEILEKIPGFIKATLSGSVKVGVKPSYGDLDIITHFEGNDKKEVKQRIIDLVKSQPDNIVVPFQSEKYAGRKYYNSGEIITILYPIEGKDGEYIQVDNIIALSDEEHTFKNNFLDIPAEKQGLILGIAKIIFLEQEPEEILKKIGVAMPEMEEDDEIEFNLSSNKLTLLKVKLKDFRTVKKEQLWSSTDWGLIKDLFSAYNIDGTFEELLDDLRSNLKNPRSKNRIKGIFKSMITVKSGEVGTPKGDNKLKALKDVQKLLESQSTEKLALLPGAFKPPHSGHYNMAKWLAANTDADTVVVKIGSKSRGGINLEQSMAIWDLYRSNDPDPLSKKLTILPSNAPSPVRDVYDFIELEAPENSTVYLAVGEKDANDKRYASIPKFAEPKGINFKKVEVPSLDGGISGEEMRGYIKMNDKDSLQNSLPKHLTQEDKDKVWAILEGSIQEDLDESGADTSWEDEDGNKITLEDILDLTKNIPIKNYPTEKLAKVVLNWDDNPEEVDRISQVEISQQYPILIMVDEGGKIKWILDGNHRAQKALRAKAETIPAKLIKPSNLDARAKKIFNLEEDLYDPNDHVLDYMKSSEFKAGMPDGPKPDKTSPVIKYQRGGKYNAATGQGGGGTMYEDHQTGEGNKKLRIYDFDDTLAVTRGANIKIKHADGSLETLDPGSYAVYQPQPGDKFDFTEFDKVIKDATPIQHIVDMLRKDTQDVSNKVTILTARLLAYPVRRYLKSLGLDVYVVAVGSSDPQLKANWIEKEINKGYDDILFVDDSEKNITAVKALIPKYPDIQLKVSHPDELKEMMGGTMNKQEMDKHAKNLKKLRKYTAKQGDQMVPVPDFIKGTLTRNISEAQINETLDLLEEGILDAVKRGAKAVSEFVISSVIPTITNLINQAAGASAKVVNFIISALKRIFNAIKRFKDKHPKLFFAIVAFIVFVILMLISGAASAKDPEGMGYTANQLNSMIGLLDDSRDIIQSTTDTVTFQGQQLVVPKFNQDIILKTTTYLQDLKDGALNFGEYGKDVRNVASTIQTYFEQLKGVAKDPSDPMANTAIDALVKAMEVGASHITKVGGTLVKESPLYDFNDYEIKYWATYADLVKKLDTPDVEETYASLKQSMIGERLEALEFFYSTYFKPDINESVFSKKWWASSMVELLEEQ